MKCRTPHTRDIQEYTNLVNENVKDAKSLIDEFKASGTCPDCALRTFFMGAVLIAKSSDMPERDFMDIAYAHFIALSVES